jgi:hypothetical protein
VKFIFNFNKKIPIMFDGNSRMKITGHRAMGTEHGIGRGYTRAKELLDKRRLS